MGICLNLTLDILAFRTINNELLLFLNLPAFSPNGLRLWFFLGIMITCTWKLSWPLKAVLSRPWASRWATDAFFLCTVSQDGKAGGWWQWSRANSLRVGRTGLKKADFQPMQSDCEGHHLTWLFHRVLRNECRVIAPHLQHPEPVIWSVSTKGRHTHVGSKANSFVPTTCRPRNEQDTLIEVRGPEKREALRQVMFEGRRKVYLFAALGLSHSILINAEQDQKMQPRRF